MVRGSVTGTFTGCADLILALASNKIQGLAAVRALGMLIAGLPCLPWLIHSGWNLAGSILSSHTAPSAEPPTRGQRASVTYDAFLSYSHQDGGGRRRDPQGVASHRSSGGPVERPAGVLGYHRAGRRPWGRVADAMDRSRYLIVVLSPRAAASERVSKEVAYWLERRGSEQLLIVVAEGNLHWDEVTQRFDPDRSDIALPVLTKRGVLPAEPLYVDENHSARRLVPVSFKNR
jgi:hypothetical protein